MPNRPPSRRTLSKSVAYHTVASSFENIYIALFANRRKLDRKEKITSRCSRFDIECSFSISTLFIRIKHAARRRSDLNRNFYREFTTTTIRDIRTYGVFQATNKTFRPVNMRHISSLSTYVTLAQLGNRNDKIIFVKIFQPSRRQHI